MYLQSLAHIHTKLEAFSKCMRWWSEHGSGDLIWGLATWFGHFMTRFGAWNALATWFGLRLENRALKTEVVCPYGTRTGREEFSTKVWNFLQSHEPKSITSFYDIWEAFLHSSFTLHRTGSWLLFASISLTPIRRPDFKSCHTNSQIVSHEPKSYPKSSKALQVHIGNLQLPSYPGQYKSPRHVW